MHEIHDIGDLPPKERTWVTRKLSADTQAVLDLQPGKAVFIARADRHEAAWYSAILRTAKRRGIRVHSQLDRTRDGCWFYLIARPKEEA